jgi:AraC-like DNA-binding protein
MNQTTLSGAPLVPSFSTATFAERDRHEAIREIYGRAILQLDVEPARDRPLRVEAQFQALPDLGVARIAESWACTRCTARHAASDDLIFTLNLAGSRLFEQRGRVAEIRAGDAFLMSVAEFSRLDAADSRHISFRMPSRVIEPLVADIGDCLARPIRRGIGALGLLTAYAGILEDAAALENPQARRLAVSHFYDLVALTLGATREAAETAGLRGARAARLREIKTEVERNLDREGLSVAAIAAKHRLPVRYVQRLFQAEGVTFTEFVRERRLARAHRMLSDARLAARPIGVIAYEAGFANQAYFNRAFRSRYGAAPSDIRAQVRRDH